jgi:hypothetical protein
MGGREREGERRKMGERVQVSGGWQWKKNDINIEGCNGNKYGVGMIVGFEEQGKYRKSGHFLRATCVSKWTPSGTMWTPSEKILDMQKRIVNV